MPTSRHVPRSPQLLSDEYVSSVGDENEDGNQFADPMRFMAAGTSADRMINVSTSTASTRKNDSSFSTGSPLNSSPTNAIAITSPAQQVSEGG